MRSVWPLTAALAMAVLAPGCSRQEPQREVDLMGAAAPEEQGRIAQALKEAGIVKEISSIRDTGKEWLVTLKLDGIGPNGERPPGRPAPEKVTIDKETMKVTKQGGNEDARKAESDRVLMPGN